MRGAPKRHLVPALAVLALALAACTPSGQAPQSEEGGSAGESTTRHIQGLTGLPVQLEAKDAPTPLHIGVIVSLTSSPGEGADWAPMAEGARVAAERFTDGNTEVSLEVVDDRGTAEGAVEAFDRLTAVGVTGIVVVSSGPHLDDAIARANAAQIPVLLPYDDDPTRAGEEPSSVWLTGPTADQRGDAFSAALTQTGSSRCILVDAGGGTPVGIEPAAVITLAPGTDAASMGSTIADAATANGVSNIVISGSADALAEGLLAVQSSGVSGTVVVTHQALSPRFAAAVENLGASTSTPLITAGLPLSDPTALKSDLDGQAMSAFLAGLRVAAEDPSVRDLAGSDRFSASAAATAHPGSHDAVVALVRAAQTARSTEPEKVTQALRGLSLGQVDGIVTSRLDFTVSTAASGEAVVPLYSTRQDIGLRPKASTNGWTLTWFAQERD